MNDTLKKWLAKYLRTEEEKVKQIYRGNVFGFLILWTYFEQRIFGGFLFYGDGRGINKGKNLFNEFSISYEQFINSEINDIFIHFHERYQKENLYGRLRNNDNHGEINKIRLKNEKEVTSQEKLFFLLYVLYRYRNNIFHGNKGAEEWCRYEEQIEKCVKIMIFVLDKKEETENLRETA
jgi:hypothetical protein